MNRATLAAGFGLAVLIPATGVAASAYEGFDYPNDVSTLVDADGGTGWDGPWYLNGGGQTEVFNLSQDDTSLDSPAVPFEPVGDRLLANGPDEGGNQVRRDLAEPFDMGVDGTLYTSFLMTKTGSAETSGGGNNLELDFEQSPLRMGSTSGNQFWLGRSGSDNSMPENPDIDFSETYFIVARIAASPSEPDVFSMLIFDSTDTVPLVEPAEWDADYVFAPSINSVLETVQLWIGARATGAFDELRIADTWLDATMVASGLLLGDFNDDEVIDPADFEILSNNMFVGTTFEQGDINLNGTVDLTDFAIFRDIYLEAGFSIGTAIPEPATGVLMVGACCLVLLARRRMVPPLKLY